MPQTEFQKSFANVITSMAVAAGLVFLAVIGVGLVSMVVNADFATGAAHAIIAFLVGGFSFVAYSFWIVISAIAGWDKE